MRGFKRTMTVDGSNPVLGDLHLTGGDLTSVTGGEATIQEIRSRLLFVKGSAFTDLRAGVPYFAEVLAKGTSTARVREIIRDTILSHPAVIDVPVLTLTVDKSTRAASVVFEARTNDGQTLLSSDFGELIIG